MILQLVRQTETNLDLEPLNKRYNVVLTPTRYSKKPSNWGSLHNELNSARTINLTLYELLEEVAQGRTWRNGIYDYPELKENEKKLIKKWQQDNNATDEEIREQVNQYHALKENKRNVLVSSNLAVLDVDDIIGTVDPVEVMEDTGAVALYYTFSHNRLSGINTKENRYRLLFDLDKPVHGKEQLEYIQEDIRKNLLQNQKYHYLNDQVIGKKSHGVENLTTQFHGTNKGYEVNTNFKTVEVSELIEQHKKEKSFEQSLVQLEQMTNSTDTVIADEILNIAHFLGDLNGTLDFDEWRTLAIGLWNTAQLQGIDDTVIINVLGILNGHEKNKDDKYYLGFKLPLIETTSRATIKTLYRVAIDRGYKLQIKQPIVKDKNQASNVKKPVMIDRFIGKENFLNILQSDDRRILLISETGTGKTRSAVEACREINKKNKKSFVYIALPVIALSEQTERLYGTNTAIIGTNKVNTYREVKKAIMDDSRLLVGTYDKAKEVCNYLNDYEITIIADEAHKEVVDYGYRKKAISNLFNLADDERVCKFVGMTGTPSEIDYSTYDSVVPFELKEPKILAEKLQFIEYGKVEDYEVITTKAIAQEVDRGNKVLTFIDNKKLINKLATVLRMEGYKVSTIQSDNRRSKTYKNILDNEKFDDETQVVLTTRVLADGINIQNTKDYVLMIAPNHSRGANFYNIDLIRQASNRFRNQYSKIMVILFAKQEIVDDEENPRASDDLYNLEYQYNSLMRTANIIKAQTESEFRNNIKHFTPSIVENLAGLFRPKEDTKFNYERAYANKRLAEQGLNHDNLLLEQLNELEETIFTIDERHIRKQASEDKERYYSLYPYAFKKAIVDSVNVLEVESATVHVDKNEQLVKLLGKIHASNVKDNNEKRDYLREVLHELAYAKIQTEVFTTGQVNESLDEWEVLKEEMNDLQYTALKNVVGFLKYHEAIRELEYVGKQAQTNELRKTFDAITQLTRFKLQEGNQETAKVFKIICDNVVGKEFEKVADKDELIESLAKKYKIKKYNIAKKKKMFDKTFKTFFVPTKEKSKKIDGKVKKVRSYQVVSFPHLAEQREISTEEVVSIYKRYMYK